jgi:hypothetical protein
MKGLRFITAAFAAAFVLGTSGHVVASSHSEAPGTASDPDIDNADTWAWRAGNNLVVVATYNGLQPPFAAPNWKKFADDALYEIHIARGPNSLDDALTYQFRFSTAPYTPADEGDCMAAPGGGKEFFAQLSGGGAFNQTYSVTKIENGVPTELVSGVTVAPPNVGPSTNQAAYQIPMNTTYEQFFVDNQATSVVTSLGSGEGRVFAGPRDDAFYVDLGGIFDLARLRFPGGFGTARNTPRSRTSWPSRSRSRSTWPTAARRPRTARRTRRPSACGRRRAAAR